MHVESYFTHYSLGVQLDIPIPDYLNEYWLHCTAVRGPWATFYFSPKMERILLNVHCETQQLYTSKIILKIRR